MRCVACLLNELAHSTCRRFAEAEEKTEFFDLAALLPYFSLADAERRQFWDVDRTSSPAAPATRPFTNQPLLCPTVVVQGYTSVRGATTGSVSCCTSACVNSAGSPPPESTQAVPVPHQAQIKALFPFFLLCIFFTSVALIWR